MLIKQSSEETFAAGYSSREGESFDDFLIALRELTKTCKLHVCSDCCMQKNIIEDLLQEMNLCQHPPSLTGEILNWDQGNRRARVRY